MFATTPVLTLGGEQARDVHAQLNAVQGETISQNGFTLFSEDPSCLSVEGNQVRGAPYPCSTMVVAQFGKNVSCEAHVLNLGEPSPYSVQLFAFDETTGAPVPRATVIVDQSGDGVADTLAPTTSETGSTHFELGLDNRASITVMAAGYHYVTFVDALIQEGQRLHIPLSPIATSASRGGVSGSVDFEAHRENLMDGLAESIQLALVAPSFPMRSLVQFDIDSILGGPMPSANCEEDPESPGCYDLGIPGITETSIPVWGGMVFSFQAAALKPFFEVRAAPGKRALWSLGGEWSYEEVAPMADRIMASPECVSNLSSCLKDYRYTLAGQLLREWAPLMSRLSLGVQTQIDLPLMENETWSDYVSTPYGPTRGAFQNATILDSEHGDRDSLSLSKPLSLYSELAIPELPLGPGGVPTDAVIALTGVYMNASGFIPTGIAAGFDCYGENCRQDRNGHDGILNSIQLCDPDDPAQANLCGEGVPAIQQEGTIGLFHAPTSGVLAQSARKTLIMALPLDAPYGPGLSVTTLILEGNLPPTALSLEGASFAQHANVQLQANERQLTIENADRGVSVITIYPSEENSANPHWTVYSSTELTAYRLPQLVQDFVDPLASENSGRVLRVTNMLLKSGLSLGDALSQPDGMTEIFESVGGFATHHESW